MNSQPKWLQQAGAWTTSLVRSGAKTLGTGLLSGPPQELWDALKTKVSTLGPVITISPQQLRTWVLSHDQVTAGTVEIDHTGIRVDADLTHGQKSTSHPAPFSQFLIHPTPCSFAPGGSKEMGFELETNSETAYSAYFPLATHLIQNILAHTAKEVGRILAIPHPPSHNVQPGTIDIHRHHTPIAITGDLRTFPPLRNLAGPRAQLFDSLVIAGQNINPQGLTLRLTPAWLHHHKTPSSKNDPG